MVKRRPRPPNKTEMLAAALLEIQELKGDPIPREHAKEMSADEICDLYQCDHAPVRVETATALHWPVYQINHPTNLSFKFIGAHREKTAKVDAPEIAKGRKVIAANRLHTQILNRSYGQVFEEIANEFLRGRPKKAWPKGSKMQSRPFQKGHRPMRRRAP